MRRVAVGGAFFLTPLIVIVVAFWLPLWVHYDVGGAGTITEAVIEEGRAVPEESLLEELAHGRGPGAFEVDGIDVTRIADDMLAGKLRLPADPLIERHPRDRNFDLPFSKGELERWDIAYPSFVIPRVLLAAYDQTRREASHFLERGDGLNYRSDCHAIGPLCMDRFAAGDTADWFSSGSGKGEGAVYRGGRDDVDPEHGARFGVDSHLYRQARCRSSKDCHKRRGGARSVLSGSQLVSEGG